MAPQLMSEHWASLLTSCSFMNSLTLLSMSWYLAVALVICWMMVVTWPKMVAYRRAGIWRTSSDEDKDWVWPLTCHYHHQDGEYLLIVCLRSNVTKPHTSHAGHGVVQSCHIHWLSAWPSLNKIHLVLSDKPSLHKIHLVLSDKPSLHKIHLVVYTRPSLHKTHLVLSR